MAAAIFHFFLYFSPPFLIFVVFWSYIFKLQQWKYDYKAIIIVAVLLLFLFICFLGNYEVFQAVLFSVLGAVAALLFVLMKEKEEYDESEINSAQKDSESIGAFWAHQANDAYYSIVLADLVDRIATYEKENGITFLVKKLVLVCPLSCNTRNVLKEKDELIEDIDHLRLVVCDQGANVNREYKNPVHRISSSLNEDVYIVAEYPSPLTTLYKVKSFYDKDKWNYHRDCFIKTLKTLLEGSPCIVAVYDDLKENAEPLSRFLLSTIMEEKKSVSLSIE